MILYVLSQPPRISFAFHVSLTSVSLYNTLYPIKWRWWVTPFTWLNLISRWVAPAPVTFVMISSPSQKTREYIEIGFKINLSLVRIPLVQTCKKELSTSRQGGNLGKTNYGKICSELLLKLLAFQSLKPKSIYLFISRIWQQRDCRILEHNWKRRGLNTLRVWLLCTVCHTIFMKNWFVLVYTKSHKHCHLNYIDVYKVVDEICCGVWRERKGLRWCGFVVFLVLYSDEMSSSWKSRIVRRRSAKYSDTPIVP